MNAENSLPERLNTVRTGQTTTLDLSDLGLLVIPDEVFTLTNLTHLYVISFPQSSDPMMPSLEAAIDNSPNRNDWDVEKYWTLKRSLRDMRKHYATMPATSQLNQLPNALTRLINLEVLNLSNQQLAHLPDALTTLPILRKLKLTGNQITRLPAEFARLTTLELLDLRRNPLDCNSIGTPNWPADFDTMPLHQFNERRDEAKRQKNLAVKAGDYERSTELRTEELRWGLHW